tara:strand:- start:1960 stop:2223 length:264 start_codon:yes stop_codon:yes gene_type:complete
MLALTDNGKTKTIHPVARNVLLERYQRNISKQVKQRAKIARLGNTILMQDTQNHAFLVQQRQKKEAINVVVVFSQQIVMINNIGFQT